MAYLIVEGSRPNERRPPAIWLSTDYSKMVSITTMPSDVVTAQAEYSFSPTKYRLSNTFAGGASHVLFGGGPPGRGAAGAGAAAAGGAMAAAMAPSGVHSGFEEWAVIGAGGGARRGDVFGHGGVSRPGTAHVRVRLPTPARRRAPSPTGWSRPLQKGES